MPPVVWFNKTFSGLYAVLERLRASAAADGWRLLVTHTQPDFPAGLLADHFEPEPRGLVGPAYAEYALAFAARHGVTALWPGKEVRELVRARDRFAALGCHVVAAADADTLRRLDHKGEQYAALGPGDPLVPDHEVVRDAAAFAAAVERLRAAGHAVCFKPAVSVNGLGFRTLADAGDDLDRLLDGDGVRVGTDLAARLFAARGTFRDVMVMPFLPGPERSVDALARRGELVAAVVRAKGDGLTQTIEDRPDLVAAVRRLAARFRLDAVFNVQFRDAGGRSYLLEINPRLSGGVAAACLAGVDLPYWALRLALGTATPADVPVPRTGLRVANVTRAVLA